MEWYRLSGYMALKSRFFYVQWDALPVAHVQNYERSPDPNAKNVNHYFKVRTSR